MSQAAQAQYLATDQARRGVTITLMSDVATTYYQLLDLDRELEIQREATNAYAGSYQIFNDRLVNGVASKLETDRAAAALANAAALIPQLEIQIATTEDQLNVLLGRNPGPVRAFAVRSITAGAGDSGGTAERLASPPAGRAPVRTIAYRRQRQYRRSVANFFPQIGLTTFSGPGQPGIVGLHRRCGKHVECRRHDDRAAVPGRAVARPIPRFEGAIPGGQGRLPTDGVDGLRRTCPTRSSPGKNSPKKMSSTRQAVVALESSVELATERYLNGKSSYYEVLQAQQELYPTQRAQVQTQAGELIAVVQLYRALAAAGRNTNTMVKK